MILQDVINKIKKVINRIDFEHHFNWFTQKFNLIDKSHNLDNIKRNGIHPIRPKKGDIYLIEFGQNIGSELSNTHMGIIMQDTSKNVVSSTVVVVPISSSKKLYDTHEKILASDIKFGKLDKLPSKAKAEQIICIDKSRLIHKIAEVTPDFIQRLEKRLLKNLDIK
jgi:mRNA-degrading endonuclease toxin of MazEF toxin-antitoxin module